MEHSPKNAEKIKQTLELIGSIPKLKILFVGSVRSGQNDVLEKLGLQNLLTLVQDDGNTIVEQIKYKNMSMIVYELSEEVPSYPMIDDVDAIIFALDFSNPRRQKEARSQIQGLRNFKHLQNVPLLVLANKADRTEDSLVDLYTELELPNNQDWRLQRCSLLGDDGILEGFTWMQKQIQKNKYL